MKRLFMISIGFLCYCSLHAQTKMSEKDNTKLSPTKTDGLLMTGGKLMKMKDGQSVAIEEDIRLKNGTMVMKDGTIKTKDGKMITLQDGDWIMMNGTVRQNHLHKNLHDAKP